MDVDGGNPQAKKRKITKTNETSNDGTSSSRTMPATGSFYKFPSNRISALQLSFSAEPLRSRDLKGCHSNRPVNTIEFSNDGSWFVSGGDDGRVLLWPIDKALDDYQWTPKSTALDTKHGSYVFCLAVSPNNDRIFSGDNKLLVHDVTTYVNIFICCTFKV